MKENGKNCKQLQTIHHENEQTNKPANSTQPNEKKKKKCGKKRNKKKNRYHVWPCRCGERVCECECARCACIELCALLQRPPSKTIEITNVNTPRLTIYVFVCFALASAFYGCEIAFYESCAPFSLLLYTVVIHKL